MAKERNKTNRLWIKRKNRVVDKIDALESQYEKLRDEELPEMTNKLKKRYSDGESLDDLLPEAFALVREASKRTLGLRHFRCQMLGGIALHEGKIAELKTGEGKTLVATLAAYLNALTGEGVHVVTVNDYLAARDAESMGKIYNALGLTVGNIISSTSFVKKKEQYDRDITYITNTELGFDYLRDNMADSEEGMVQRKRNFAIIDEADSILIDEARTPLIISGSGEDMTKLYVACNAIAKKLKKGEQSKEFSRIGALMGDLPEESGDFFVNEKEATVTLTESGIKKVEEAFGIDNYSDKKNVLIQHAMDLALRALYIMKRDKDYVVKNGKVQIVDTFTGRVLPGRRFSDGLHQAIEAKEHVEIQQGSRTLATITYQLFFLKYKKIAGMTGTAYTARREFKSTYHMKTIVIPTNMPMIRVDRPDVIYTTKAGKYKGIVEEVKKSHDMGQPVLIGTASVEASEELSEILTAEGIRHRVLNAKQDAEEADIIAKAGEFGSVTVATNMAGRGTDIVPSNKALEVGGLKVIGTERHEARRIDNQLRGRSGRQGNVGESVFYLSTEDQMIRLFSGDRFKKLIEKDVYSPDEEMTGKMFKRAVIRAQKSVEDNNFARRKRVLEYDKVDDAQRDMIYAERKKLLAGDDVSTEIQRCVEKWVEILVNSHVDKKGNIDKDGILEELNSVLQLDCQTDFAWMEAEKKASGIIKKLSEFAAEVLLEVWIVDYQKSIDRMKRQILLQMIDAAWMDHLSNLEYLRQDIWYLGYAQIDSQSAYAQEAFKLYDQMRKNIYRMTAVAVFRMLAKYKKEVVK